MVKFPVFSNNHRGTRIIIFGRGTVGFLFLPSRQPRWTCMVWTDGYNVVSLNRYSEVPERFTYPMYLKIKTKILLIYIYKPKIKLRKQFLSMKLVFLKIYPETLPNAFIHN